MSIIFRPFVLNHDILHFPTELYMILLSLRMVLKRPKAHHIPKIPAPYIALKTQDFSQASQFFARAIILTVVRFQLLRIPKYQCFVLLWLQNGRTNPAVHQVDPHGDLVRNQAVVRGP